MAQFFVPGWLRWKMRLATFCTIGEVDSIRASKNLARLPLITAHGVFELVSDRPAEGFLFDFMTSKPFVGSNGWP